jgi:hypothetical protein
MKSAGTGDSPTTLRSTCAVVSACPVWTAALHERQHQTSDALVDLTTVDDFSLEQTNYAETAKTLADAGVDTVLLLCAGEGLSKDVQGLAVVEDHINYAGSNPLIGMRTLGSRRRFVDMRGTYDATLQALLMDSAAASGLTAARCVAVDTAPRSVPGRLEKPAVRVAGIARLGIALHAMEMHLAAAVRIENGTFGDSAGYDVGVLSRFVGRAISALAPTDMV